MIEKLLVRASAERTPSHPLRSVLLPLLTFVVLALSCAGLVSCGNDDEKKPGTPKVGDSAVAAHGGDSAHDAAAVVPGYQGGTAVAPETAFSLKLSPHVGDVYRYRVTQKGFNEIDDQRASEDVTYWFTQKITGVNSDGSFTVDMQYDSIVSRKTLPAGVIDSVAHTFNYDTRRKVDSSVPDAAQAKALVGHRVNLTISKGGEVREVSNLDPILTALLGSKRDSVSPEVLDRVRDGLKASVFQAIVQQIYLQSPPDSNVHIASSWSRRDSLPLVTSIAALPSTALVTYSLAEAKQVEDRTLGRIVMTLVTTFTQKKLDNKQLSTMVDEASTKGSGEVVVDIGTGYPMRKQTQIDIHLKLTAKAKVGPSSGKTRTVVQNKSTSTIVEQIEHRKGS